MLVSSLQFAIKNRAVVAALLALLLSMITYNSNGVIRGGDEDNGSGLGGTGRTLNNSEPTGSGFGGTGFRPFIGFSEQNEGSASEIELVLSARQDSESVANSILGDREFESSAPLLSQPIEHELVVADPDEATKDSAPLSIAEAIQWEVDTQIVSLETSRQLLAFNDIETSQEQQSQTENSASASSESAPERASFENQAVQDENRTPAITWAALAQHLNANEVSQAVENEEDAVAERPERFQRPILPPVQRVQPVQRAGLLPPRIRPLKL